MQKNKIALFSCAALVAAGVGLNIQNAIADYGIGENSLSLIAVPSSGSGSNLVDSNASALASNTNGSDPTKPETDCYWSFKVKKSCSIIYCGDCSIIPNAMGVPGSEGTCKAM